MSDELELARMRAIMSDHEGDSFTYGDIAKKIGVEGGKSLTAADYQAFYDGRPDLQSYWNQEGGVWPTKNIQARYGYDASKIKNEITGGTNKKDKLSGQFEGIETEGGDECSKQGMGGKANSTAGFGCWAFWNEINQHGRTDAGGLMTPSGSNLTEEQIKEALGSYELSPIEKRTLMMTRFGDIGFNEFNKYIDYTKGAIRTLFGFTLDDQSTAQYLSQNSDSVNALINAAVAKNEGRDFTLDGIVSDAFIDAGDGTASLDSSSMSELEKATIPYDFEGNGRIFGSTEIIDGKRVETGEYYSAADAPGWSEDPLLGTLYRSTEGNNYYSESIGGWIGRSSESPEWFFSYDTRSWMWPHIGQEGQGLLFYAAYKEPEGGEWLAPKLDGSGSYYDYDDKVYRTSEEVKNMVTNPDTGKASDDSNSSEPGNNLNLEDPDGDMDGDGIPNKDDTTPTGFLPTNQGNQKNLVEERVPNRISYDTGGNFAGHDVANKLAGAKRQLDDVARDLAYEGFDSGYIQGFLSQTEIYKDFMDFFGEGENKTEARNLIDGLVKQVADKHALDENMAKSLDMFDAGGAGMLDPRMSLEEKLAIRNAKPSRPATAYDVAQGLATEVGELIRNPQYDPALSYYFEWENPDTGELETKAYRPDMPGKHDFMALQEDIIHGGKKVLNQHIDDIVNPIDDDGNSKLDLEFKKQRDALQAKGIMAGGEDDLSTPDVDESLGLYANEGAAALNYVYGDDGSSLEGKMADYYDMQNHLRDQSNFLKRMDTKRDLDTSAKIRAAIDDLDPVERARDRSADRIRMARFGGEVNADMGGIRQKGGLYESSLDPELEFKDIDNITGLGDTYTRGELEVSGLSGGLVNMPQMTETMKVGNQYSGNVIQPKKTMLIANDQTGAERQRR